MLYAKKDVVSLLLFGTNDSFNPMYTEGEDSYSHINTITEGFEPPTVNLARALDKVPDSTSGVRNKHIQAPTTTTQQSKHTPGCRLIYWMC
jgi:hypothetical protein